MNSLIGSCHSFFRRAKERRDRRLAERLASEFKGYDLLLGNETNSEFNSICAIGPVALPTILSMLNGSKWIMITETSRELITKMRTPETLMALLSMLDDPKNEFRGPACTVLGIWREKSAVERLIQIVLDENEAPGFRQRAVRVLGEIGDHSAIPAILSLLPSPQSILASDSVSSMIAPSAATLGVLLANNPDTELFAACINALGELGGKSAIPRLREFLPLRYPFREAAIVQLARLGDTESVPLMIEMTRSKNRVTYNAGAEALCTTKDLRGAKPLAELLLSRGHHSNDLPVRAIIRTLGELGDECAIPALFAYCKNKGPYESDVKEAIAMLGKFRCIEAYSALAELLFSCDSKFAGDLKAAVLSIGAPAVPFIIPKLDSPSWQLAANILVDMGFGVSAISFFRKMIQQNPEKRFELLGCISHATERMAKRKMPQNKAEQINFSAMSLSRAGAMRPFPTRPSRVPRPAARMEKAARPF